jgi:hypothetical protein
VAQEFVTLKKAGYEKEELIQKLRETYNKHRGKKDALLVFVTLKQGGPDPDAEEESEAEKSGRTTTPDPFFSTKPGPRRYLLREGADLLAMQQGKAKRDLTWLKDETPKPSYQPWKVHIYDADKPTQHPQFSLAMLESQELVYCRHNFSSASKEPITITVRNVWTQRRSIALAGSHRNSINVDTKEVSCTGLKSLEVPPMQFPFLPAAMSLPEPPDGFSEIFDLLKGK